MTTSRAATGVAPTRTLEPGGSGPRGDVPPPCTSCRRDRVSASGVHRLPLRVASHVHPDLDAVLPGMAAVAALAPGGGHFGVRRVVLVVFAHTLFPLEWPPRTALRGHVADWVVLTFPLPYRPDALIGLMTRFQAAQSAPWRVRLIGPSGALAHRTRDSERPAPRGRCAEEFPCPQRTQ